MYIGNLSQEDLTERVDYSNPIVLDYCGYDFILYKGAGISKKWYTNPNYLEEGSDMGAYPLLEFESYDDAMMYIKTLVNSHLGCAFLGV